MHFFRQSLISPLLYSSQDTPTNNSALFPIDPIINQPLHTKDRKDLNKIYEQADIFVKRNSIITINNKKQKKLLNSSFGFDRIQSKPLLTKQDVNSHVPAMGKQGALFQQIHPADVQKNHDDNVFDYRLHMKLSKGDQVFKVEQVKRKQKKKPTGKECQCCGRQFSKYHKCVHSICERKCGKPSLKKSQSRRDMSSMYSDSKDENWSQQNYDEEKVMKGLKNDKKSGRGLNRSSSNKDGYYHGESTERLFLSIEKLITEKVLNNFSYKVLQIKQFEDESESAKDMELQEDLYDESLDQNNSNHIIYPFETNQSLLKENIQSGQDVLIMKKKQKLLNQLQSQKYQKYNIKIQQEIQITDQINKDKKKQKMEVQNQKSNRQVYLQEVQGQNQNNKSSQNPQKQKQNNKSEQNQQKYSSQASHSISPMNRKIISSGSSSSSENINQRVLDLPEEVIMPMNEEDQDNLISNQNQNNLPNSKQNIQSFEKQEKLQNQDKLKDEASLPEYKQDSDSLDDELNDIQQFNLRTQDKHLKQLGQNSLNKLSKKQSKKLKIIQKQKLKQLQIQKLKSDNIQELEPIIQTQLPNKPLQNISQSQKKSQIYLSQKHGKGKGKGMGHGYGIFQEQLDIYNEDESLLQQDHQKQSSQQIFQKIQQKPLSKSLNSIELQKQNFGFFSSINYQPGTPRRKIPKMEEIIEQIKLQSQKVEDFKGLGRGKIFGRGLGVLQQTQQLEKQLQEDDYLIRTVKDSSSKKVKLDQGDRHIRVDQKSLEKEQYNILRGIRDQKIVASNRSGVDFREEEENKGEIIVDKFDELIEQQGDRMLVENQNSETLINSQAKNQQNVNKIHNNSQIPILNTEFIVKQQQGSINRQKQQMQNEQQQQDIISDKFQPNYISYLNKKESLIHPQIPHQYPFSEEDNEIQKQPSQLDSLQNYNKDVTPPPNQKPQQSQQINLNPISQQNLNPISQKDIEEMIDSYDQPFP